MAEIQRQPLKCFGFKNQDDFVAMLRNREHNVAFVRFIAADILGETECSFTVPAETITHDENTLKKGFDASSLYPERINESDKVAVFDPRTARILPLVYHTETPGFERAWKEAVIFGDVIDPKQGEYLYDSRTILKKIMKRAKDVAGADTINFGPELEFFLFQADENGKPLLEEGRPVLVDEGAYFKGGRHGRVRKEAQLFLTEMGYAFEYDHHEVAHSQHEIDIHYMNALEMADFVMLYRYVVKRVARAYGFFASFMPKPVLGVNGSGMHVHQSFFKGGRNLFFEKSDPFGLSEMAYRYMAGLMKYIPEITLFLNQWVNSYRRLVPGYEAPVYICWDPQNRSNLIRKPEYDPGKENATRLELRSPDPAANPYLAFAMMIAAGLKGIEEKSARPEPSDVNVYGLTQHGRDARGIKSLPGSLEAAIALTEKSALVKGILGERFLGDFIKIKKEEAEEFRKSVAKGRKDPGAKDRLSGYEIEKLLPIL